jgi:hypothetical protein
MTERASSDKRSQQTGFDAIKIIVSCYKNDRPIHDWASCIAA